MLCKRTHNKRFERDSLRWRFAPPPLAAQAFRYAVAESLVDMSYMV